VSEFVTKQIVAAQVPVARRREHFDEGPGLVKYVLILGFIALMVIMALKYLGHDISNTLNDVATGLHAISNVLNS
jgi:Flp pilus assembly pilin Flp